MHPLPQILPPLRDVSLRPEEGSSVKSRLIRLMTHLDTDLKHCAADLIFVLCKENGEFRPVQIQLQSLNSYELS